nr:TetR/AcrR family transcriptional regulator [Plantactinospora alkalitolerans]
MATVKRQPEAPVGSWCRRDEPVLPGDRVTGQGVEQKIAQCAAVDLGTSGERAGLRLVVHEGASGRVEDAMFLALGPRLGPEPAGETRLGQGTLPGFRVQVERSALRSRGSVRLAFVHHRFDAAPAQDPRQGQAAESATDDRDSHPHLLYRTLYLMDTPYGSEVLPVWERPEPAPRAAPVPLSRAKIAATAIRLADAHGLDGLSVRKIAKELGVGPMRLYDYVINRSELLDLMVDAVYSQIAEAGQHSGWRATVLAIVHRTREAALEHEWFSDLLGGRPHLGPHALAVGESTAAALSQAPDVRGIDDLQRALGALNAFIVGALRREVTERRTARSTGTDVTAWQASLGPYLTRMLETGRYPTVARLVIDGAHLNAEETFHHNLTTILDGITNHPHT